MIITHALKLIITSVLLLMVPAASCADSIVGFDITPSEFNERFVAAAKATTAHMPANEPENIVKGQYNSTYFWDYGPNYEFTGYVSNTTGLTTAVKFIGEGDGTPEGGGNILLLATSMFMAANSDSTSKEHIEHNARLIIELLEKLKARTNQFQEVEIDDGRFTYFADQVSGAGTWFSIEASSGD